MYLGRAFYCHVYLLSSTRAEYAKGGQAKVGRGWIFCPAIARRVVTSSATHTNRNGAFQEVLFRAELTGPREK